jgi:hypothetical protein
MQRDMLQTLLKAKKKDTQATRKQEGKLLLSLDNYLTPKRSRSSGRLKRCWKSCWSCCRPWVSKKYFSAELVFCLGITIIISYFFISSHSHYCCICQVSESAQKHSLCFHLSGFQYYQDLHIGCLEEQCRHIAL